MKKTWLKNRFPWLAIFGIAVLLPFQNCGVQQQLDLKVEDMELSSQSTTQPQAEVAPLDAKQLLESMMSQVGVTPDEINKGEVNGEINYRRNLLIPSNELSMVSSPTIIATTSLAAVVCKQAVTKEKSGKVTMFKFLDFTKGPGAHSKDLLMNNFIHMADQFWLRRPGKAEVDAFNDALDSYYKTLDQNALGRASETDKLALFMCTAMLASPDSYTL